MTAAATTGPAQRPASGFIDAGDASAGPRANAAARNRNAAGPNQHLLMPPVWRLSSVSGQPWAEVPAQQSLGVGDLVRLWRHPPRGGDDCRQVFGQLAKIASSSACGIACSVKLNVPFVCTSRAAARNAASAARVKAPPTLMRLTPSCVRSSTVSVDTFQAHQHIDRPVDCR